MAHNSEAFYKVKNLFNNFFSITEIKAANTAMVFRLRRQRNNLLKGTKPISGNYQKAIQEYWKPYKSIDTKYHQLYSSKNGMEDVRYIPDDLYYTAIDQHFNNRKYGWGVNDKNYYSLLFPDVKQPEIVVRKINGIYYDASYHMLSEDDAMKLCGRVNKLIIKPANETGGSRGIKFWNKEFGEANLRNIFGGGNYVAQKLIVQHEILSEIHPSSVNTLRVISLLMNGKVNILSTVLRMGVNGNKVDNASAGGITCGVLDNGKLKDVAYSADGVRFEKHPQGYIFSDCVIPNFEKVIHMVETCHEKMGHFRLVSWDIAIGEDGEPILIEANLRNGECDFHQYNNGPLFGELTEQVLDEVFRKRK